MLPMNLVQRSSLLHPEQVLPRTLSASPTAPAESPVPTVAPMFFMDSQSPNAFLGCNSASMDRTPTPSFQMQDFAGHHTPSFQLTGSATASAWLERFPSSETAPVTPPQSSVPDALPFSHPSTRLLGRTRGRNAQQESEVQHTSEPSAGTSSAAEQYALALSAQKAFFERQARRQSRPISTTE